MRFRQRPPRTEAEALAALRGHLIAQGLPGNELTDDQLRAGAEHIARASRMAMMSVQTAQEGMLRIARSLEIADRRTRA